MDAAEAGSHRVKAGENSSGNLRLPNNCHRDDEDHFIRVKFLEGEVTVITVALRNQHWMAGKSTPYCSLAKFTGVLEAPKPRSGNHAHETA